MWSYSIFLLHFTEEMSIIFYNKLAEMPGVAREKKSYIFVLCYLQGTHGFPQKI